MLRPLRFVLPALAVLLCLGCASEATRFATAEIRITLMRGTKPAARERLIVWIEEHRLDAMTDANGEWDITENYPWTAQAFSFPPVGSLTHSSKPIVAVSLASDPAKQFEGVRTAVPEGDDVWKMTIRADLDQAP
jgi:hypothetical protein